MGRVDGSSAADVFSDQTKAATVQEIEGDEMNGIKSKLARFKKLHNDVERMRLVQQQDTARLKDLSAELDKIQEDLTFHILRKKQSYTYTVDVAQVMPSGELRCFHIPGGYYSEPTELDREEALEYSKWIKSIYT